MVVAAARFLSRGSRREVRRVAALLRTETVGGLVLVAAAVVAMVWANSAWAGSYLSLRDARLGPAGLHLDLTVGQWAADGLLAIFFFLVGLELKHEFVAGDLRSPGKALVPVAAAAGGVLLPALLYLAVNRGGSGAGGWAIPAATDIAFALAVLAIISSHLPAALRTFLLTLAVVDDLIAIVIIAVAYTTEVHLAALALALVPAAAFGFVVHRWPTFFSRRSWSLALLLPFGVVTWVLVHESGIHATIAGVVLGALVPVRRIRGEKSSLPSLEHALEHHLRPLSAGVAVPLFALFAAGVPVGGLSDVRAALAEPVTLGIIAGLVLGKPIGIVGTTFLVTRLRHVELDESIAWKDLIGLGCLAGIGFTVSLLVVELSFETDKLLGSGKLGVLAATLISAVLAGILLSLRNRRYRRLEEQDLVC